MLPIVSLPYIVLAEKEKTSVVKLTPEPVALWEGRVTLPVSSVSINRDSEEIYALLGDTVSALLPPNKIENVFSFTPSLSAAPSTSAVLIATSPPFVLYTIPNRGIGRFAETDTEMVSGYTISPTNNRLVITSLGVAHVVVRKDIRKEDLSSIVCRDAISIKPYLSPHFISSHPPQFSVGFEGGKESRVVSYHINGEQIGEFTLVQPKEHPLMYFRPACLVTDSVAIACFRFMLTSAWVLISIHTDCKPSWAGVTSGIIHDMFAEGRYVYICTRDLEKAGEYKIHVWGEQSYLRSFVVSSSGMGVKEDAPILACDNIIHQIRDSFTISPPNDLRMAAFLVCDTHPLHPSRYPTKYAFPTRIVFTRSNSPAQDKTTEAE